MEKQKGPHFTHSFSFSTTLRNSDFLRNSASPLRMSTIDIYIGSSGGTLQKISSVSVGKKKKAKGQKKASKPKKVSKTKVKKNSGVSKPKKTKKSEAKKAD